MVMVVVMVLATNGVKKSHSTHALVNLTPDVPPHWFCSKHQPRHYCGHGLAFDVFQQPHLLAVCLQTNLPCVRGNTATPQKISFWLRTAGTAIYN
jgi:hypothetical protein